MEIRKTILGDEAELIELFSSLEQETDFMLMQPGESNLTKKKQIQLIKKFSQSSSQTLLVANDNAKLIGFLGGTGGSANRERHSIKIAMGILESYWGQGIGMQLLNAFFSWARNNDFHRIELTTSESNERAKALYTKAGFKVEGLKQNSLKVNGRYVNELVMAKLLME